MHPFVHVRHARAQLLGMVLLILLQACTATESRYQPETRVVPGASFTFSASPVQAKGVLRVMSLNMAHSRGEGFHQALQKTSTAFDNLEAILEMLREYRPDVVALQEADGKSFWNGKFDHVEYLARHGWYQQYVHGEHVKGGGLSYGTALLSGHELENPEVVTFSPESSVTPKGFVVSTVQWPGEPSIKVDVVSVHLDFSSESKRRQQASKMIEVLRERQNPVIIMGDFNTGWEPEDSAVRLIAGELGLVTFQPADEGLHTFPSFGRRLDWILVSPRFRFVSHSVIPDAVSDHRAVIADLDLNGTD